MQLLSNSNQLLETEYSELATRFDIENGVLWTLVDHAGVPCFTQKLLSEICHHHKSIESCGGQLHTSGATHNIRYSVIASLTPGVFNLGGQLSLFRKLIRNRDRETLLQYATLCIDAVAPRIGHFKSPIITIALVQGDALGGGLEAALTSDVIIAERRSLMGFPEILFNLFPGMGAYSLLARKIGARLAEKVILSGKTYKAEELYEMGLVDVLVEDGAGEQAVYDFIKKQERCAKGYAAIQQVKQRCSPVVYQELIDIATIWVDTALKLNEKDLRVMDYFVSAQEKLFAQSASVQQRNIA